MKGLSDFRRSIEEAIPAKPHNHHKQVIALYKEISKSEGQTMASPSKVCTSIKALLALKPNHQKTINGSVIIPLPKGKLGNYLLKLILEGEIAFHEFTEGNYCFIKSELEGFLELESMRETIEICKQVESLIG